MLGQKAIHTKFTHPLSTQLSEHPLMPVNCSIYGGAPDTTQGYNNIINTVVY